jgi:hypothetical protein
MPEGALEALSGPIDRRKLRGLKLAPLVLRTDRGCSSDGRALQSHCRGQGFESPQLHQIFHSLKSGDLFRGLSLYSS